MTQHIFDLNFQKNQAQVCTIDKPLSKSMPMPHWFVPVRKQRKRRIPAEQQHFLETDHENI